MKHLPRILIAIAIFLSGTALVPFVGLPADGFRWQKYADAYQPMSLELNYTSGFPGSFFTVRGFNFPADQMRQVSVNGVDLGPVQTDSSGEFLFLIDTTGAEPGYYFVTTDVVDSPTAVFQLNLVSSLRSQEDTGQIFNLPADSAMTVVKLPLVQK